jgi:hypothetical protein
MAAFAAPLLMISTHHGNVARSREPAGAYRHRDIRPCAAAAAGPGVFVAIGETEGHCGRRCHGSGCSRACRGADRLDEAALEAQRAADEALDHESPVEELFQDQLRCADLVVLNKADLVAGDILAGRSGKNRS